MDFLSKKFGLHSWRGWKPQLYQIWFLDSKKSRQNQVKILLKSTFWHISGQILNMNGSLISVSTLKNILTIGQVKWIDFFIILNSVNIFDFYRLFPSTVDPRSQTQFKKTENPLSFPKVAPIRYHNSISWQVLIQKYYFSMALTARIQNDLILSQLT